MSDCPPRPKSEEDTGFHREEMTRWLSPGQLVDTGIRVILSGIFGAYADKRESQEGRVSEPCNLKRQQELWFDYVSDLGDGFNPTYALATLLAEEKLDLGGADGGSVPTQRGSLLVMGGDQVYPTADIDGYRNKMIGPYQAALPYTSTDHPQILALPGNHDWYDGLTAFTRVFCQRSWIGGWRTGQRRSYFAAELPHGWWLWGIDIQFDTYIDEPQLEYFAAVAEKLQEGDSVILCSAKPNWVAAHEGEPAAYDNLEYFQRRMKIESKGAKVRLQLSGDAHHYARYAETTGDSQLITAGGGGAFVSATHNLPNPLELPPVGSTHRKKRLEPVPKFALRTTYPDKKQSRRIALQVVSLPRKNPSFVALLAAVYVLYAWTIQSALRQSGQKFSTVMQGLSVSEIVAGIARSPVALLVTAVVVLGMSGFTKATSKRKKYGLGAAHALAHLAAVVGAIAAVDVLIGDLRNDTLYLVLYPVLVGVIGGLVGSMVMAAYLYLADRFFDCNANELFAAQRLEGYKNFLRLHIDANGTLTVYPVKVERVPTKWELRSDGRPEDPWFVPVGDGPQPSLIEQPIRIPATSAQAPRPQA